MRSVKHLMGLANPVPECSGTDMSARAHRELTVLTGVVSPQPGSDVRAGRRHLLVGLAVGGVVAAAVGIGAVVVVAEEEDPRPPSAAEPFYPTTTALERRADIIVRATIENTRERDRAGTSETIATVRVRRAAKGDAMEGQTLEVMYTTPRSGPPETPDGLHNGGEYVLLLETVAGAPANLVSTIQGYYTVEANRPIPDPENPVNLSETVRAKLELR